ncbi:hypothetical protein AU381_18080 [Sinorhizobium glycinis]|uniref:Uncharacterized protein n=1 Tax=Sinorhizobium glycinis TaxID=1472378 RepID=A0A178XME7_9HYPH|nr:4'-phosphopantetheinyl transferase superfamily protein [Sinorhizobium glycinis]OAP36421.1 hypothetical protein AU381_18080 [Sinorhizobium glycinis]
MPGSQATDTEAVEIHWLYLGAESRRMEDGLSQAEKDRAARLRRPKDRLRYVAARRLCRAVLGARVGRAPDALQIGLTETGKPWLPDHPGVSFSLSHSGDAVVLAISEAGPIGVDVEQIGAAELQVDPDLLSLVLSADERSWFEALPAPERAEAFLGSWVKKEAVLKCLGTGLLERPDEVPVAPPFSTRETISLPAGRLSLHSGTMPWNERCFLWAVAARHAPSRIAWRYHETLPGLPSH